MTEAGRIARILRDARTIAVVGLSPKPDRPSHAVARYLQTHGYRVIPVNPGVRAVLGETAYPSIDAIPPDIVIDVVDVFRKAEETPPIAAMAVRRGARALWLQLGVRNEEAAALARAGGLDVIMDRCIKIEHERGLFTRPAQEGHDGEGQLV